MFLNGKSLTQRVNRKNRGFTLVEVAMVLIIMGIMAAVTMTIANQDRKRDLATQEGTQLAKIKAAADAFAVDYFEVILNYDNPTWLNTVPRIADPTCGVTVFTCMNSTDIQNNPILVRTGAQKLADTGLTCIGDVCYWAAATTRLARLGYLESNVTSAPLYSGDAANEAYRAIFRRSAGGPLGKTVQGVIFSPALWQTTGAAAGTGTGNVLKADVASAGRAMRVGGAGLGYMSNDSSVPVQMLCNSQTTIWGPTSAPSCASGLGAIGVGSTNAFEFPIINSTITPDLKGVGLRMVALVNYQSTNFASMLRRDGSDKGMVGGLAMNGNDVNNANNVNGTNLNGSATVVGGTVIGGTVNSNGDITAAGSVNGTDLNGQRVNTESVGFTNRPATASGEACAPAHRMIMGADEKLYTCDGTSNTWKEAVGSASLPLPPRAKFYNENIADAQQGISKEFEYTIPMTDAKYITLMGVGGGAGSQGGVMNFKTTYSDFSSGNGGSPPPSVRWDIYSNVGEIQSIGAPGAGGEVNYIKLPLNTGLVNVGDTLKITLGAGGITPVTMGVQNSNNLGVVGSTVYLKGETVNFFDYKGKVTSITNLRTGQNILVANGGRNYNANDKIELSKGSQLALIGVAASKVNVSSGYGGGGAPTYTSYTCIYDNYYDAKLNLTGSNINDVATVNRPLPIFKMNKASGVYDSYYNLKSNHQRSQYVYGSGSGSVSITDCYGLGTGIPNLFATPPISGRYTQVEFSQQLGGHSGYNSNFLTLGGEIFPKNAYSGAGGQVSSNAANHSGRNGSGAGAVIVPWCGSNITSRSFSPQNYPDGNGGFITVWNIQWYYYRNTQSSLCTAQDVPSNRVVGGNGAVEIFFEK